MAKQEKPIMINVVCYAGISIFGAVVAAAMTTASCNLSGANHRAAVENAQDFAEELGLKVKAVTCNYYDRDNDGYVSCSFAMDDGKIEQFECASFGLNTGCRRPKFTSPAQAQ